MPYTREEAKKIYDAGPEAVADVIVDLSVRQEMADRRVEKLEKRYKVLEKKVVQLSKDSSNSSGASLLGHCQAERSGQREKEQKEQKEQEEKRQR